MTTSMNAISPAVTAAYIAKLGMPTEPTLSRDIVQARREAGAKASATKGETGHRRAWLKAKITMATRQRDALTGSAKGKATRGIRALERELAALA